MKKEIFIFTLLSVLIIFPFNGALAIDYLNAYPEYVYYWDGTAYVPETGDAQSEQAGDVYLGKTAGIGPNILYVSMGARDFVYTYFDKLHVNVTTAGEYGEVIWEYLSDSGWKSLDATDDTASFTNAGWNEITWDIPDDWMGSAINSKLGFWARARTTTSYGTIPLAGQMEVRAYNLKVKVVDSSENVVPGLAAENFSISQCSDPTIYAFREIGDGVYEFALQTKADDINCSVNASKAGWTAGEAKATGDMLNYVTDLTGDPLVLSPDVAVSASVSTVSASPLTVAPDGESESTITVTVRNSSGDLLSGKTVTLTSSRGSNDQISPSQAVSDELGQAAFKIKSSSPGQSVLAATAEGVMLDQSVSISFSMGELVPGTLVKLYDDQDPSTTHDSAVYYYASDNKRYVFPNDKIYFSWYEDFFAVTEISQDLMSQMTIGGNVTYRPGYKMVKIQTDPKVYAVEQGGVLRWIKTEELAQALYGAAWNTLIEDVPDSFWVNYSFGDDITAVSDFDPDALYDSIDTIDKNLGLE
ncbi:Ig-like domain-containing protein [Patescibacteria group bacterium]|nr:Ig-like domain-containing protein [Patescibacteria group bacterium]MBU1921771.1 Ig-like domain-containing protein [Patescibacteria group bacterium]